MEKFILGSKKRGFINILLNIIMVFVVILQILFYPNTVTARKRHLMKHHHYDDNNEKIDNYYKKLNEIVKDHIRTKEKVVHSWIGAREQELLLKWGAPNYEYPDGRGGKILIFLNRLELPDVVIEDHDLFYINKTGIIYFTKVKWGYHMKNTGVGFSPQ